MARWLLAVLACLALTGTAAGCSDSDDDATAPGTGGSASAAGGSAGTAGSGGGPSEAGSGGTSNGSAGAANGSGGAPNGDAGNANGAAGTPTDGGAGGDAADHVPYANVVAVAVTGDEGAYNFSVSVESSDTGCDEYANWWEVLTESGELSYRRIIDHSHTDANGTSDFDAPGNTFTRGGGPVPVAAETTVIVRAHMSVGGYNGMALRGSVVAGFTQAPDIDGDFAAELETAEPQPTTCTF